MNTAIANFRTVPNGAYQYMSGKKRGYWRVLIVRDQKGPLTLASKNVIGEHYVGPEGIRGVTERSGYYIGDSRKRAFAVAAEFNSSLGV